MKTQNPWLGRMKGSAGNMTGCKVYDKNVLKAKAFEVSNPQTPLQVQQRNFFNEAMTVVNKMDEEVLRTLYGIAPKGMSRRSALAKLVLSKGAVSQGVKSLDWSAFKGIGNGSKTFVETTHFANVTDSSNVEWSEADLQISGGATPNIILVVCDKTAQEIKLVNTEVNASDEELAITDAAPELRGHEIYVYPTIEEKGKNVYLRGWGSFIVKTRAEK